jgi:hypothetical protein
MNDMEPFEQRLKRQPLRPAPAGWRKDILSAAREVQLHRQTATAQRDSFFALFNRRFVSWLWPHPVAWGGLAAVWVFITAVHFSIQDKMPMVAEKVMPPSPEMVAELRQQQRMFAELIGVNDSGEADRPKVFVPQPRSERINILTA